MTNPTACREAFEKWALSNFLDITWIDPIPPMINESHYYDNDVMQMWLAYQDAWNIRGQEGDVESDADYRHITWLIGQIFFYGNFKAETYNERQLEALLRKTGNFHDTQKQADDAALAKRGEVG